MLLPIAAPGETTASNDLKVVAFAAFQITSIGNGRLNGTLLDDYIISGKDTLLEPATRRDRRCSPDLVVPAHVATGTAWPPGRRSCPYRP